MTRITPCPFCYGRREDCEHCSGTDKVPIFRCPNQLVKRAHLDYVTACVMTERGILPDAGGWQDQPATFLAAFPIVMDEVRRWREIARKKAEADAARRRRGR